tara:strand:+ start:318 stop:536 length:219 start_codon:yes stop_codon:yes gene_type:complete
MKILIESRNVWGNELTYVMPEDGATAKAVRGLTGKKTIDNNDMESLRSLGHSFLWVTKEDIELAKVAELVQA